MRSAGWEAIHWAMALRLRQNWRLTGSVWADWRGRPRWRQRPSAHKSNSLPEGLYFGPMPSGMMRIMLAPSSMALFIRAFSSLLMNGETRTLSVRMASSQAFWNLILSSGV